MKERDRETERETARQKDRERGRETETESGGEEGRVGVWMGDHREEVERRPREGLRETQAGWVPLLWM